jgi:hypothetical protein
LAPRRYAVAGASEGAVVRQSPEVGDGHEIEPPQVPAVLQRLDDVEVAGQADGAELGHPLAHEPLWNPS